MKASEKSLTFLKEMTIYVVPYFQRGYVWNESNWEGIWEELTAPRKDCFLGSIILKKDKTVIRDDDGYVVCETPKTIIDGQQRLTTLTILLRALYDFYSSQENPDEEFLHYFDDLFFYRYKKHLKGGIKAFRRCNIEHSRLNQMEYRAIIEGKVDQTQLLESKNKETAIQSSLLQCYKFFLKKLRAATEEELNLVCDKLTLDESKILVVINLDEDENEQAIFDTINSTGVKLTASDIIKNALFHKITKSPAALDDLYKATWQKTFEETQELLDQWLETKGIGQNQRSNIDHFFYSFAIIKEFFHVPGDKMTELAQKYKEYISGFSESETEIFIREICDYANIYKDTFMDFDDVTSYSYDDGRNRLLQILNTVKITAFDPFILYAISNYSEKEQESLFKKLETYVIRHYVIGNSSKMGRFLMDAADMIKGTFDFQEKLTDDLISDDRLERALKSVTNVKAKLLLFWIELHRQTNPESDHSVATLKYSFELEHIMPQKWIDYWGLDVLPIVDENGNRLPNEEAAKIRRAAIYEIGNMTLLTSRLNKELQNYAFSDKVNGREIKGKFRAGMKEFASLQITKEVIRTEPLVWNEEKISERTRRLTDEIKQIWPI